MKKLVWQALIAICATGSAVAAGSGRKPVSAKEFRAEWPLTVVVGELSCARRGAAEIATFKAPDGKVYALNGAAEGNGFAQIDPIWKDNTEIGGGAKISIRPLIDAARELCK